MKKILLLAAMVMLVPITVHAYLVDTGDPVNTSGWFVGNDGEISGSLTARFELGSASNVTCFRGFFFDASDNNSGGTLTGVIYSGDLFGSDPYFTPDVSNQVFSQQFNIGAQDGWYGVDAISLTLNPGAYWVAFESRVGDTFYGAMPDGTPSPLLDGAFAESDYLGGAYNNYPLDVGVRVCGNVVPEPVSTTLFLLGGATLAIRRLRRK